MSVDQMKIYCASYLTPPQVTYVVLCIFAFTCIY